MRCSSAWAHCCNIPVSGCAEALAAQAHITRGPSSKHVPSLSLHQQAMQGGARSELHGAPQQALFRANLTDRCYTSSTRAAPDGLRARRERTLGPSDGQGILHLPILSGHTGQLGGRWSSSFGGGGCSSPLHRAGGRRHAHLQQSTTTADVLSEVSLACCYRSMGCSPELCRRRRAAARATLQRQPWRAINVGRVPWMLFCCSPAGPVQPQGRCLCPPCHAAWQTGA
jgi:hypothetical protein